MAELLLQFWETQFSVLFDINKWMTFEIRDRFKRSNSGQLIMIGIACLFLYLAIKKGFEPYLLIPIATGMLLVNIPLGGIMETGGLMRTIYIGTEVGLYPPLIFLCVGAGTDFGPLIANPRASCWARPRNSAFFYFHRRDPVRLYRRRSRVDRHHRGADGPTALFLTSKLADHLMGPIAIAAYSYMALVPIIQPPIMKALTTEEERKVKMEQLRPVSKTEKIVFPIIVTILTTLLLPSATALIGMLMAGNLIRESGVVPRLADTLQNTFMYIITVLLGFSVGGKAQAELFLTPNTLFIILLGLVAFSIGTAAGVLFGKIMYKTSGGKVNPLIGAAGVSAVPMAARVVQKEGQKYNPANFLLMHAMGPNVAGVIGSAVAAGVLLMFFS